MGDDKILGGGGVHMGLRWDNFLRHGACLVLSSPLDMGGFWRSPAPHPRQNLVQYPPPGMPGQGPGAAHGRGATAAGQLHSADVKVPLRSAAAL